MSDILIENSEGVTTVTLNRLARKNAITASMYAELAQAVTSANTDTACRVLLIQGHETVFSAGNDIEDFLNNPRRQKTRRYLLSCVPFLRAKSPFWPRCVALRLGLARLCCCIATWFTRATTPLFRCLL